MQHDNMIITIICFLLKDTLNYHNTKKRIKSNNNNL